MPIYWQRTDLSTSPPSHQMADTDRHALPFAANITVATVAATLETLPDLVDAADLIESAEPNETDDGAIVVISGLTSGTTYRLTVTMTAADTTTETGVLVIECVA